MKYVHLLILKLQKKAESPEISEWARLNQIKRPTHQMALAWLREEHKIVIQIGIKITGASYYYQIWDYSIIHPNKFIGGMIDLRECAEDFNSYEEAVEAALKYVLENLT